MLISELKSEDLLDNECTWNTLLNHTIDARFDVATQVLEFRTLTLRDGTVNKRLNEIQEHQNIFEHHYKV